MISDYVPKSVLDLPTEANTDVIFPWFEKSLAVPGDVCEFGCFRGTLSIKLAFWVAGYFYTPGSDGKAVYCFDTFEGFEAGEVGGGYPETEQYRDAPESLKELTKWFTVLPLWPVKGDARETCAQLKRPLSFVWFDLDVGQVMETVRQKIWHLITPETIIGVDDYGRPECPTVQPWAHRVEYPLDGSTRLWDQIGYDPDSFIAWFRKR